MTDQACSMAFPAPPLWRAVSGTLRDFGMSRRPDLPPWLRRPAGAGKRTGLRRRGMTLWTAVQEGPMLEEFKKFALKGNVVDLAIGIIIGAAFGRIVESLVGDIFMPIVGAVTGGLDFSNWFIPLSSKVTANTLVEARKQGAVLAWGNFVTVGINFLIIAWILFLMVKAINQLRQQEAKTPTTPPSRQEVLLEE